MRALVAALLLAVASAPAAAANLLANPGAEDGPGAGSLAEEAPPPGWTTTPRFTAVRYGAATFPPAPGSASGANFFAGGPDTAMSTAAQIVDVSFAAQRIDGEEMIAALRADIGSFGQSQDRGTVDAIMRDAQGAELGRITIGPVLREQRHGSELVPRSGATEVPRGTRSIEVVMTAVRVDGTYADGWFDNLDLTLTDAAGVDAVVHLPPAARGVLPLPSLGATVLLERLRGRVRYRPRLGLRPVRRWRRLRGRALVRVGSIVDARRGTVRVTSEATRRGEFQEGDFTGGPFTLTQSGSNPAVTVLTLRSPSARACRASASRRRITRLRGTSRGHHRTRGRWGSGTSRSTTWTTEEVCGGTALNAIDGSVLVNDFFRDEQVLIGTGNTGPSFAFHDPPPSQGDQVPAPMMGGAIRRPSRYVAGPRRGR
jgi:hypothetical protein